MHLETERLYLRPPQLEDAPAVRELVSDERIARMTLNIPHPYPEDGAITWIQRILSSDNSNAYPRMIERKDDDTLVGHIGMGITPRHNRAEVGYWVGVPYWGRGYATEALSAMIDFGFSQLSLHRITGQYYVSNPASGRVMEKVGMIFEGTLRDHVRRGKEYKTLGVRGILRQDWEAAQK
jgi:RimJ/RimL family protein N-acetyltransferase